LLLVDVQGISYEETAQIMNCSLGTVKSRVSRGRNELRDFLRATGELLPSQFRQDR
jgi:RNA polymerase sigma-70 factor, ECF subfamily